MKMQNQMYQQGMQQSPNMQPIVNHGGHEIFEAQEVISGMIGILNQYQMYNQFIQDQELSSILLHQYSFISDCYNIMVESFSTGSKPSHGTKVFNMQQSNDVVYGLKPSQPQKPVQSINEIGDQCISSFMLGQCKSMAGLLSVSACEITNPVLRRVIADSVPNFIEMAYEVFLYQNKHHYYQVPQLQQNDMNQILHAYTTTPTQQMSQQPNLVQQ